MGIRKKISLAFLCLALMLGFSGVISMLELGKMSRYTEELLKSGSANISILKQMLDAAQEENTTVLQMMLLEEDVYFKSFHAAHSKFLMALEQAEESGYDKTGVAEVRRAWNEYDRVAGHLASRDTINDARLFLDTYTGSYLELTSAIKSMITDSQHTLAEDAVQIKSKAYRAITPGIIALGVAIVMLLMFAFLIDLYYTRPTLGITKGLRGYLDHKIPFNVKMEGKDEVRTLKNSVEELVSMYRNKKNCREN